MADEHPMSADLIIPAPPLFVRDDLRAIIEADFAARGISAVVECGEWSPEVKRGASRVVIGLGDFRVTNPDGHHQPGAVVNIEGTNDVARVMLDDVQTFRIWVHAPGKGTGEAVAKAAERATMSLKRLTIAAIRRYHAAPFREDISGTWPKPSEKGYEGYVHGSVCMFDLAIATGILDDPLTVAATTQIETETTANFPDGANTPAETTTT